MWVEFDIQQPWHFQGCLSSALSIKMGVQVWQLRQQDRVYILKFLSTEATAQMQQSHLAELNFYQALRHATGKHQTFYLAHQVLKIDAFYSKHFIAVDVLSDILVLPYVRIFKVEQYARVDLAEKIKVFKQLCQTVAQLHQFNVIHGDLKPQHFFIESHSHDAPYVGLLDFAQVQHQQDQHGVKERGGTPAYMAPELFLGQAKSVQTDIYALGIIFYQLLMGNKPYYASSYAQWAVAHCQQEIPELVEAYQCCQSLLDQLLAKRLEHRFSSISAILNALNISDER